MTDFDVPLATSRSERPDSGRPAFWRIVSLLTVAAAAIFAIMAVFQTRSAGDVAEREGVAVDTDTTRVTLGALGLTEPATVLTLGLDEQTTVTFLDEGVDVEVPNDTPAVVALYGTDRGLYGLALIRTEADRTAVEISADSTARALIALSPAVLQSNLEVAFSQVDVIAQDAAFGALVQALAGDASLSRSNPAVENALAEILDRVPNRDPFNDQGCDSVLDTSAYAAAGACIQPGENGVTISNEQDRWALLFDSGQQLCAPVAPAGTVGSAPEVQNEQCAGDALLVAPGPIVDRALGEQVVISHIRSAAAVELYSSYAAPFADLAGGAAGAAADTNPHLIANAAAITATLDQIAQNDPAFSEALNTLVNASTPVDRHQSGVSAARAVLDTPTAAGLFRSRSINSRHVDLVDFFERTGERMIDTRTDWRWVADSVGDIAFPEADA